MFWANEKGWRYGGKMTARCIEEKGRDITLANGFSGELFTLGFFLFNHATVFHFSLTAFLYFHSYPLIIPFLLELTNHELNQ